MTFAEDFSGSHRLRRCGVDRCTTEGGEPTQNGYACLRCTNRLGGWLRSAGRTWALLGDSLAAGKSGGESERIVSSSTAPLPIRVDVAELRADLWSHLAAETAMWRAEIGIFAGPVRRVGFEVGGLGEYLARWVGIAAGFEWFPASVDAMSELMFRSRRVLYGPTYRERIDLGACVEIVAGGAGTGEHVELCGGPVQALIPAEVGRTTPKAVCGLCGAFWAPEAWPELGRRMGYGIRVRTDGVSASW